LHFVFVFRWGDNEILNGTKKQVSTKNQQMPVWHGKMGKDCPLLLGQPMP
jgi:hypothetical protein